MAGDQVLEVNIIFSKLWSFSYNSDQAVGGKVAPSLCRLMLVC